MSEKTLAAVWDYEANKLVFLKVYDSDEEYDNELEKIEAKFQSKSNPYTPITPDEQEMRDILWVDDERYDIITSDVRDGETLEQALARFPLWQKSIRQWGMPSSEL